MKLRELKEGEHFKAEFYNGQGEVCMTLEGEYLCPSEEHPELCVCRFDGVCVGYEPADLEVERIEG